MSKQFYPHIDTYLTAIAPTAAQSNCSELRLTAGHPPLWKIDGNYAPIWPETEPLDADNIGA